MKNFRKKWFISASSGLFGRLLFLIIILGGGIVGSAYLLPEESRITKVIASLIQFVVIYGMMNFFWNIETFKNWWSEGRETKIRELELKNENLKLELELQQQKKQPTLDNDEE